MLVNILVALSNFIGFYFSNSILICFPIFASFLYHLAEIKHELPGIYPLNKYSGILLNIDRLFAIIGFLIVLKNFDKINLKLGIFGLLCLMISERDVIYTNLTGNYLKMFKVSHFDFLIFHCIWHVVAYYILASVL
jgi:hypothetical protein